DIALVRNGFDVHYRQAVRALRQIAPEEAPHLCLHHRYPSTGKLERWLLYRDERFVVGGLPVTMAASTLEPLTYLAEQVQGLTCVPLFAVRRQIEAGTLVAVL